jgi:peptidoglycan/LPS O-acetylase OafA/YrhL
VYCFAENQSGLILIITHHSMTFSNDHLLFWQRSLRDRLAEKLSRVTSTGELIPEIDGLRFIAIGAVILHHLMSTYLPIVGRATSVNTPQDWQAVWSQSFLVVLAYCGHFGVHLFFVISGFILALPFARRYLNGQPAPDLKSYYLRRVTRLEPPYVLCLLVFFIYHWAKTGEPQHLFPNLMASIFYAHGLVYGEASRINGVAWSLEIEIQFYLLVPLLVRVFHLRRAIIRRTLLMTAIVLFSYLSIHVIGQSGNARLWHSLPNFLHFFLTGFLLADFYLTVRHRKPQKYFSADVITITAATAIPAVLTLSYNYAVWLPVLIGLMYVGFYYGRISNLLIRQRWIVIAGGMCYTIYLYHTMLIGAALSLTKYLSSPSRPLIADFLVQCLLVCPVIFILCSLLFVFTEKPFMKWSLSPRQHRLQPISRYRKS